LKRFRAIREETKKCFNEKVTELKIPGSSTNLNDLEYWNSRTITVVADMDTGIVVTGATKAVVPEIPILDAANNISHIRVGEDFGSIIDACSKDVWNLLQKIRPEIRQVQVEGNLVITPELASFHTSILSAPKDSVDAYQQIPCSKNGIRSWAFGNDFNFKPPCTRCQRLYSEWILHKKPCTDDEKLKRLKQDQRYGLLKYRANGYKYPCTYCAETVAAAKLHTLYHGTLTLVLSKDTDDARASDYGRTA